MEIKKIKLLSGGFKGAEVTYLKPEEKDGKKFVNEVTEKRKYPIHFDMEKPFRDLRYHMLEICGLIRNDMEKYDIDYVIAESDVVSIKFEANSFIIAGTKTTMLNKDIKLVTPKVEADDSYHHFDTVMKMIETIIEEAHLYLSGTKQVSDEEVAVRYITSGKDKSEQAERYNSMTLEEKKQYHTDVLEKLFGSIVMHNDDIKLEDIDPKDVVEIESTINKSDEIVLDSEEILIPLPKN